MTRTSHLSTKLIGLAAVAAVGLPLSAMAQQSQMNRDPATTMPKSAEQSAEAVSGSIDTSTAMNSDDLIGANVRNSSNDVVGKIDSLLVSKDARVVGAVVDVGGFLGIGAHQVVIPMTQLSMVDEDNVSLPSATKESLKALPEYKKPEDANKKM